MKKKIIEYVINVLIYALTTALAVFGLSSVVSCTTATHFTDSQGKTTILTNDTTIINHGGTLQIKIK